MTGGSEAAITLVLGYPGSPFSEYPSQSQHESEIPPTALYDMSSQEKRTVASYRDAEELPPAVKQFLSNHTRDELCLSEFWFELLARYSAAEQEQPRIYVVTAAATGAVECVLFVASSPSVRGAVGARRLVSLTNFYTMSYAPIIDPTSESSQAALKALAAAIIRERPKWDVIELRSVIKESPTTDNLLRALRGAGLLVDTYHQFENWYQPLVGLSGEDYFKRRPTQVRNTITRKLKRAKREHRLAIEIHRTAQDLQVGIEQYQRIYARSWKEPELFPEFIPQLLRACAERGLLRLGVLTIDDDPAAAQIWLVTGSRATIYKLAYDERYRQLSVGSILTKAMFDDAIEVDHVSEVDYGVGSETYKLDWMSKRRHIVGIIAFNPRSIRGLLCAAKHFAGRLVRAVSMRRTGGELEVRRRP